LEEKKKAESTKKRIMKGLYYIAKPVMFSKDFLRVEKITKNDLLLKMREKLQYLTEAENIFLTSDITSIGIYEVPIKVSEGVFIPLKVEVVTNEYIKHLKDESESKRKLELQKKFDEVVNDEESFLKEEEEIKKKAKEDQELRFKESGDWENSVMKKIKDKELLKEKKKEEKLARRSERKANLMTEIETGKKVKVEKKKIDKPLAKNEEKENEDETKKVAVKKKSKLDKLEEEQIKLEEEFDE
jgi:hypothetical protein